MTTLRGWRLFFPLGFVFAAAWVPIWLARRHGLLAGGGGFEGAAWHGHEMLFGWLAAMIAGFVTVADSGRRVLFLVGLWAGARALILAGAAPGLAASVDLAFLPLLALLRRPPLWSGGKTMTLGILAVIAALTAANGWAHLAADPGRALATASDAATALMVIVAGRLVPGHTRAATRRGPGLSLTGLERASAVLAAGLVAATASGATLVGAGLAAALCALQALRLLRWRDRAVLGDPLLWGLHLGFGWLVAGLALHAAAGAGLGPSPTEARHAILVGGAGTLTLAVAMRLMRAQSGRPQRGGPGEATVFALVSAAAVLRAVVPAISPGSSVAAALWAGAAWSSAMLIAAALYARAVKEGRGARTRA